MSANGRSPAWIAADWGTSNLRAWAMSAEGAVLAEAAGDAGAGNLKPDDFEPALLALIDPWLGDGPTPVIACGMVGSRQGWIEAGYLAVPTAPRGDRLATAPARDPRLRVHILAGVSQTNPADVMRGEETQIAGLLVARPAFDGVVCLPGTHSKWVHVTEGEIFHFASYMTGELFALLAERSILRHSVAPSGEDEATFLSALDDAYSRPERIVARLFTLRAEGLLAAADPVAARARLSGYLIGLELAGSKPYWLGREVALIGAGGLSRRYRAALRHVGVEATPFDATATVLDGLRAARAALAETGGPPCGGT